MAVRDPGTAPRDGVLVRIHDPAGRPRGTGVVADRQGTVLTSHEAVDGLARLVLRAGERSCVVPAEAVTALPERNLALVPTEGLAAEPLPLTVRDRVETGAYVRIAAGCWREARVLGAVTEAAYPAADRLRRLDGVLQLAIGTAGRDALRPGGGAAGGPVVDAATGAVVALLATGLHTGHRDWGLAVPLRPAGSGPLADLLARNAATVPAYGADLNLAGVLALTATSVAQDGPPEARADRAGREAAVAPAPRAAVVRESAAFTGGPATVLALVGPPGSGRTTELAALAARRARDAEPAPTVWLRGADLRAGDASVADAVRRALHRAARIVAAARDGGALLDGAGGALLGDTGPDGLAGPARAAGQPLLLLLDGPEQMPPALAHRLPAWAGETARWLEETGARLVVACRAEYWEQAGAAFPAGRLHPGAAPAGLPPCVPLGDLDEAEARRAHARHGLPDGALAAPDARHALTLRLLGEVLAARPDVRPDGPLDRYAVLAAHLDLMCLRVAVRLAAENGLRGTAVRRLAAKVAGQVHEAARRSLGSGHGELDRDAFEALFPWGRAPARLGGGTGWASAVLTEGLLVPAGTGYRFAHEEVADWLQGIHLDLDEALRALVHHRRAPGAGRPAPLAHHRAGPVVQALLLLARQHGPHRLAVRLEELLLALDADPHSWWAARLLGEALRRVPDATPYLRVLRLLADAIADWRRRGRPVPREFGPAFWTEPALPGAERLDLLRRLVLADTQPAGPDRYLDTAARLLAADPVAVQPHLVRWFDDERPLPAAPHATVATAAQALLHTHRHRALDDLTEVLAGTAHRRGGELLGVLAEEEPSAVCRAVDRWAHDERPARRAAAVAYGPRTAPHARGEADRALLRRAALAQLARPADAHLHGGALALLVRDPHTRARYLPRAVEHFAAGDPQPPASALLAALAAHPEPVLDAFRARLHRPGTAEALCALADAATPAPARRVAALLRDAVALHPDRAAAVAACVGRRLDAGTASRTVLVPLVTGLLEGGCEQLRVALADVLAAPGPPAREALRRELCDLLLVHEEAPPVLEAVLRSAVRHGGEGLRALVHRTGMLLVRTPEGATRFDRTLLDLGRAVPGFAAQVAHWLDDAPRDWAAVVGPSTRRMIQNLAGARVPA
ncbi:trypsin-like peptidase domain-containing protein [Streptomyces cinereospinus]|uniref:Trypsin-like peptidase domain-containing protein n=1 Tax=Streptomyces cinereospinus TaxID=285561 RepID=A0ABV5N7X7_9ACTN